MNILLINDASGYHSGCMEVLKSYDFKKSFKVNTFFRSQIKFKDFNKMVINGEGTMHHNGVGSQAVMSWIIAALREKIPIELVNTVWQDMAPSWTPILKQLDKIEVREVLSQQDMLKRHGVESIVVPDRSIRSDVPYKKYEYVEAYEGQYWHKRDISRFKGKLPRVNIFSHSWYELVNRLRHSDLLITGRHHEIYAAIKARCKFIIEDGNTHKNSGVFLSAGVPVFKDLQKKQDVLDGKYNEEFEKLFEYYGQTDRSSREC